MADVQTTDINTKPAVTAIDSNDQIFISDGGTALKKISYTNLAKAIIEQYNASQLAGATKTIQTAINDLNSKNYTDQTNGNSLLDFVATLAKGTYNFRLDNAPEAPVTGGVIYTIKKTHPIDDTRCSIIATAMNSSDPDIYSAFVGQNATSITWKKAAKQSDVDALNSKTPANPTVLTASDDMNNITTPGVYAQWNDNTPLHAPTTQYNAAILVYNMRPYEVWQIWASANTKDVWTRMKAGGNWTDWRKQPTRAEMDAATVKTLTVTATADANGYIDTGLKYNQAVPLCVYSVTINGSAEYPFLYEFLMRGGSPAEKITVRIKKWNGEVYTGEITFSMKYI